MQLHASLQGGLARVAALGMLLSLAACTMPAPGQPGGPPRPGPGPGPGPRPGGVKELCNEAGNVRYQAWQEGGMVILTARGTHPSTGYRAFFEQSMIRIFPPQYSLFHQRPTGMTGMAVTPFQVRTSFPATEPVSEVTVHDARGRQQVRVERGGPR